MRNFPYPEGHGDITCMVKCFENVIEMNFVIDDGVGSVVDSNLWSQDSANFTSERH